MTDILPRCKNDLTISPFKCEFPEVWDVTPQPEIIYPETPVNEVPIPSTLLLVAIGLAVMLKC